MSSHVSDCISSVSSVCRVISVKLITKGSEQTVSEIISERQTLKIIRELLGSYKPRDTQVHCVFPESIHTPPTEGFFGLNPSHPHPSGNSTLGSYIPLKILAFNTPLPLPVVGVWIFSGTTHWLCGGANEAKFLHPKRFH